jgi:hypothetical protein
MRHTALRPHEQRMPPALNIIALATFAASLSASARTRHLLMKRKRPDLAIRPSRASVSNPIRVRYGVNL